MLIHNFVRIAAGSSNGRTADFESVNLGSIPSPAAMRVNITHSHFTHSPTNRTADFESVNLGSIPSLAAKIIIFPGVEINFP